MTSASTILILEDKARGDSKHKWNFDGPHYVTYKKSDGGLQYIGYTGNEFKRNDELYYTRMEQ